MFDRNPFANLTPVVKNLLIINIICFIPVLIFDHPPYGPTPVSNLFAVYYFNSPKFRVWQIITYMFLHGGWEHILFNMFALFSFGPILEYSIGSKRFFNFYFLCGVGAIFFQMLVQAVELHSIIHSFTINSADPHLLQNLTQVQVEKVNDIYATGMVGASGAIFGVLIAFGMLYPDMELMVFLIPIPIKAKYLIPVYIIIELYLGLKQNAGDDVAHFAHLGGALVGFIVIKIWGYHKRNNIY